MNDTSKQLHTYANLEPKSNRFWWSLSIGISTVFLVILILMWSHINTSYRPNTEQLTSEAEAEQRLSSYNLNPPPTTIPTGVFIETFRFKGASEVALTGIIWQTYIIGKHDHLKRGFQFPEEVDSFGKITQVFSITNGNKQVIGWHFDASLYQTFDYSKYPLDHKTVWLRMWPGDAWKNVLLTPNLSAYTATGLQDIFGLDIEHMALGGWEIEETYFDFQTIKYGTNWGIRDEADPNPYGFPDLYYNIVIKRNYLNAAITNFMPLLTVAVMLFAAFMLVTDDKQKANSSGFSISNTISTAAGLLFVLIISHVQLRQAFPVSGIVYIEYFYIVMYCIIVGIIFNVYQFGQGGLRYHNLDNIIPKLLYWPSIFGVAIIITLIVFQDEFGLANLFT